MNLTTTANESPGHKPEGVAAKGSRKLPGRQSVRQHAGSPSYHDNLSAVWIEEVCRPGRPVGDACDNATVLRGSLCGCASAIAAICGALQYRRGRRPGCRPRMQVSASRVGTLISLRPCDSGNGVSLSVSSRFSPGGLRVTAVFHYCSC